MLLVFQILGITCLWNHILCMLVKISWPNHLDHVFSIAWHIHICLVTLIHHKDDRPEDIATDILDVLTPYQHYTQPTPKKRSPHSDETTNKNLEPS